MILVTGGTGYIGSHTVVELINAGYETVIIDDLSNSSIDVLDKIKEITGTKPKFYEMNILDKESVNKVFCENKIDAVIHFAAFKAVGESVSMPLEYYHNNVTGTVNLLSVMKDNGCKKFVFSSSATVYGMNNPVPFKEEYPTSATNPYGYTKVMNEQILMDMCVADSDFTVSLLRYFNPIGAHESGLIGEKPNGIPNNLLPYVMKVATGALPALNVFGDDYDTVDGTGVRDYIHVVDLAKGHLAAMKYILDTKGCTAVNLGTGMGTSVLEIVDAVKKASGVDIPVVIAPRRAGDIATCYADTQKAKELFSWTAEKGIEEMCKDSWKFSKLNF